MLEIRHKPFHYIFIPCDIADAVVERLFEGTEGEFQEVMKHHFSIGELYGSQKDVLRKNLTENAKTAVPRDQLEKAMELSHGTYQIIPLVMPLPSNNWRATNLYIDNIGRVKELSTNTRATRIASENIRGDAFLACARDCEEDPFERVSCSMSVYEELLESPPSSSGRWSQTQAVETLQKKLLVKAEEAPPPVGPRCENCFRKESS